MFSHFNLAKALPAITDANSQADAASQLVLCGAKVLIICLAVLWSGELLAATDDDLSKEYSVCIDNSGGVTPSLFECNGDELDRQDARLNDNYKKLMSKLSRDQRKVLLEGQRAWMIFRKTSCELSYQHAGGNDGGSAARLGYSGCFLTMTAARATELKDLRDPF
jgi:uncharacterized protein YecT (DUF1311 family)